MDIELGEGKLLLARACMLYSWFRVSIFIYNSICIWILYLDLDDPQLDLLFALPPSLTYLYAKASVSLANNLNCCGISLYRDWIDSLNNSNLIRWFRVNLKRCWLSNLKRPCCGVDFELCLIKVNHLCCG